MNNTKNTKNAVMSGGLVIAACAVCCAPLIATPVIALFAAGGAGLALAGQIGLAILFVAAGGAFLWWRWRDRVQRAAVTGCSCAADAGCNTGDACEVPAKPSGPSFSERIKSLC